VLKAAKKTGRKEKEKTTKTSENVKRAGRDPDPRTQACEKKTQKEKSMNKKKKPYLQK